MIVWRPQMAVGNDAIDEDHRHLLKLLNEVETAFGDGASEALLRQALARLIEYTDFHFKREERLQRQIAYPGHEDHAVQHIALKKQLAEIVREVETLATAARRDPATVERVAILSREWLINHILGEDLKMKPYFVGRSPAFT